MLQSYIPYTAIQYDMIAHDTLDFMLSFVALGLLVLLEHKIIRFYEVIVY